MSTVKGKSKISKLRTSREKPKVLHIREKDIHKSVTKNNDDVQIPSSSVNIPKHNPTSLFHSRKQDDCLMITAVKIDEARKTGQLQLSKANLSCIPKKVFTVDRLDETEAKSIEVTLDESAVLNWWEFKPLEKLDLSFNTIKNIPDDIKEVAELRVLDLQHNCLEEISDEISSLKHLHYLNLSHNRLTTLCNGVYKLKELNELLAVHNLLKDLHENIGDLSCLVILDLSHNSLSHLPNGIGFLSSLKELNLSHNQLTSLPSDFSGLCGLVKLNLKSNQFRELPSFEHLIYLTHVDISMNCMEDLPNMANCIMLQYLDLSENSLEVLEGSLISSWPRLKQLYINNNNISELPSEVCMLYSLITLDVSKNNLTKLPETLSLLPELRSLKIQGNKITGIPVTIIESDLLRYLRNTLSFHKGSTLQEPLQPLQQSHPLQTIYDLRKSQHLKYSEFNAPVPPVLIKDAVTAHVKSVDISKNKLIEIPSELKELEGHLQVLDASFNYLSSLPTFVGLYRHLNALILSHNCLTDLPSELGQCESLKELYIDFNRFTSIPGVVYKLVYLERLNAESNSISVINVEGLKELKRLAYLEMSNNNINKVPSELGNMKHIMFLGLTGNLFRHPNYEILRKPTADLLQYLRDKV